MPYFGPQYAAFCNVLIMNMFVNCADFTENSLYFCRANYILLLFDTMGQVWLLMMCKQLFEGRLWRQVV